MAKQEYRCTLPDRYPLGTPPSAREGHYVTASSPEAATTYMQRHYPGETVHCVLWGPGRASVDETTHYRSEG